jgi:hypothetical protein
VKLLQSLDGVYFLPQVQPNPVTNTLGVHFYSNEDGPVRLRVVAVNGVQMMEKKYALTTGGHYAEISATDLPKGYFWLVVDGGGQRQAVVPFVKN